VDEPKDDREITVLDEELEDATHTAGAPGVGELMALDMVGMEVMGMGGRSALSVVGWILVIGRRGQWTIIHVRVSEE